MPRSSGRDTPLAWFTRTLMRGGNRSAFLCVPGSALVLNGNIQTSGAPERWWGASWRRGSGRGGGGSDRIITCQLHVKQQSSGRWSRANRTQRFPVGFYWTPRAAVPGAWCDVWKCSGLDNCLWFFFFLQSELFRLLTVAHSWVLNVHGVLKRPSFKVSIGIILF